MGLRPAHAAGGELQRVRLMWRGQVRLKSLAWYSYDAEKPTDGESVALAGQIVDEQRIRSLLLRLESLWVIGQQVLYPHL